MTNNKGKITPQEAERLSRQRLDEWAARQHDRPDRDEAVRRMIKEILEATSLKDS